MSSLKLRNCLPPDRAPLPYNMCRLPHIRYPSMNPQSPVSGCLFQTLYLRVLILQNPKWLAVTILWHSSPDLVSVSAAAYLSLVLNRSFRYKPCYPPTQNSYPATSQTYLRKLMSEAVYLSFCCVSFTDLHSVSFPWLFFWLRAVHPPSSPLPSGRSY